MGTSIFSLEKLAAEKVRPAAVTTCARESWMLIGSEKLRTTTPGADERRWPGRGCEEMRVEWAEAACGSSASTAAASTTARRMLRARGFFFSSRRRHTRFDCDWSSDVCSSD